MPHLTMRATALLLATLLTACGASNDLPPLDAARAFAQQGEWRSASIEARNAVAADSEDAEARLLLAELSLRLGDPATAQKELERAEALGMDPVRLALPQAQAALTQGRFDAVLAITPGDTLESDDRARLLALQALAQRASGNAEAATASLAQANVLGPELAPVVLATARIQAASDESEKATEALEKLVAREDDAIDATDRASAYDLLGDLHRFAGRTDQALQEYARSAELAIVDVPVKLKIATLAMETGGYDAALSQADDLAKRGVELPLLDYLRGRIAFERGELLDAQALLEGVLTEAPDEPRTLSTLALTHLALGNTGQADQYAKQLVGLDDSNVNGSIVLGLVRLQDGNARGALEAVESLLRYSLPDQAAIRVATTALLLNERPVEAYNLLSSRGIPPQADESAPLVRLVFDGEPADELRRALDGTSGNESAEASSVAGEAGSPATQNADEGRSDESRLLDARQRALANILALLVAGRTDAAVAASTELLAAYPEDVASLQLASRAHLAAQDIETARALAERAARLAPGSAVTEALLAGADAADGDLDAARDRMAGAFDLEDASLDTWLIALRIEAAARDEAAALALLERAATRFPNAPEIALPAARADVAAGRYEEALARLSSIPETAVAFPEIRRARGMALSSLGRHDEALEQFDALLVDAPDDADALFWRSRSLAGSEDADGMKVALDQALAADPGHVPSLLASARLAIIGRQYDQAAALRDRVASLVDDQQVVATLSEQIESAQTGEDAAGVDAQSVDGERRIELKNGDDVVAAASQLWQADQQEQAVALMNAWLERNPDDRKVAMTLANTYMQLDREDEATTLYERVIENTPDDLIALNNAAWLLQDAEPERAFEYAQRAVAADPQNASALDTLAMIALRLERTDIATDAIGKAVALAPEESTIRLHGAIVAEATGDLASARSQLESLLADVPVFERRSEAEALLRALQR